jgi:cytokinin dehydrogenase
MPGKRAIVRALAELARHCESEVLDDVDTLAAYARNFGRMCACAPALVVRPRSERDLLTALQIALQNGLSITTRGAGHCQSSQSLGAGVLLDMTRLRRVIRVDREQSIVEAEAGATWHQVIDAATPLGLLPVGLSQIVDTTVGGTLSIAGIGAESFRCGPQVDNVAYLDVVTLDGQVRHCARDQHSELFDAVRAGLGQCGVILRVGYSLRPCASRIETRGLVYRDATRFLEDACSLASSAEVGRWLTCSLVSDPFDPSRRALVLFVGQEYGQNAEPVPTVRSLQSDFELRIKHGPLWDAGGSPGHPFFQTFAADQPSGEMAENSLNPWVEHLVSLQCANRAVETLLDRDGISLGSGSAGIRFVRRGPNPAPLFIAPPAELLIGIGAFASFAVAQRDHAESSARACAERFEALDGKRHLSGYMARTAAEWAEHYGEAWGSFCQAKRQHDPGDRLNAGFLQWPGPADP